MALPGTANGARRGGGRAVLLGQARQRQLVVRTPSPGCVLGRSRAFARVAPCVLARLALRTTTCRCLRRLVTRIPSPGRVLGRSRAFARVAPCVLARLGLRTTTCRCLRQLALGLVCLVLASCDGQADEAADALGLGGGPNAAARVTRHTDGDTLWLSGIGKVRLIGIDTPEVFGETECYGRAASAFVRRVAPLRSRVRYRLGVERRDRYGRALAYVWLRDGRFLNRLVLLRGYGEPLTIPPNVEHVAEFERAAASARAAGRGMWGRRGCAG